MRRWIPWITGILAFGALVWTFFYLKDVHPLGALGTRLNGTNLPEVGIQFKEATLIGRSDGKRIWEIKAKAIDISKDRRFATFEGITRGDLIRDGRPVASISANRVIYNTFTQDVTSPGAAELKVENGPSLKVRKVFWNAHDSKLLCEDVDAVLGPNTMHGERLTADLQHKEIVATKVKGQIKVEE